MNVQRASRRTVSDDNDDTSVEHGLHLSAAYHRNTTDDRSQLYKPHRIDYGVSKYSHTPRNTCSSNTDHSVDVALGSTGRLEDISQPNRSVDRSGYSERKVRFARTLSIDCLPENSQERSASTRYADVSPPQTQQHQCGEGAKPVEYDRLHSNTSPDLADSNADQESMPVLVESNCPSACADIETAL